MTLKERKKKEKIITMNFDSVSKIRITNLSAAGLHLKPFRACRRCFSNDRCQMAPRKGLV